MQTFMECGWMAYVILLAGLGGVLMGILGLVLATRSSGTGKIIGGMALALGVLTVLLGFAGEALGRRQVAKVLEAVEPSMRQRIEEVGYREAAGCVEVGGAGAVLPLLLGAVALTVAFSRKPVPPAA